MLGAFFDDSGTHAQSPVVVVGGLLGTDEQWEYFETAWESLLKEPLPGKAGLRQFHLSPCRARTGEFCDYSQAEIDAVIYSFRRIVVDVGFVTLACAVNRSAWNDLVTEDIASELPSIEQACLSRCLKAMLDTIRFRRPGQQIYVFLDHGTKNWSAPWAHIYRSSPEKYPEIACIAFAPVSKVVALQGADMIATETYQFAQACMKNGEHPQANPHFREFLKRELSIGLFFDHEHIAEMVTGVRASKSA